MSQTSSYFSKLELRCTPSAIGFARRHARQVFNEWEVPKALSLDASTVISELTTNAVRHARQPVSLVKVRPGQPKVLPVYALGLWITRTQLRVGVWDLDNRLPEPQPASLEAEGGRGLLIVDDLSKGKWGAVPVTPRGKLVWAALPLPTDYHPPYVAIISLCSKRREAVGA
ncbi:ATP-binding protein [Streptomyces sp. NRRL F-5123]|uniref:ATP-binding protein n=1 Tax=Streptomyces sp. NRRL F-5123 TaxID=1463856 RepID=UPI000693CF45|nr:ATP-binding protein [Streptomyces sp. NRRL F-5123]